MPALPAQPDARPLHLGLDAGGTGTRWALADADGRCVARGQAPAISGLMLADAAGHAALAAAAAALRQALGDVPLQRAWAGVTGLDPAQAAVFAERLAGPLGLPAAALRVLTDIELACRAAFAPGRGVLVYAGTGSVAAHLAADGTLHRAGGRGAVIDDAGGGHWIATEALKAVWRAEDRAPGAGQHTALGRALLAAVGGSDWAATRAFVYGASRGELGQLARVVAAVADSDPTALALLQQAGQELARLVQALHQRPGLALASEPVALAGRVFELHPAIEAALRAALPGVAVRARHDTAEAAEEAAARAAAAWET